MADDIVIRAEKLGKKYVIGHQAAERHSTFRDAIVGAARGWGRSVRNMARGAANVAGDELEEFWALKDINFEIRRGDVVGIIGRNGAGKSTLLKVLSRITEPSEGKVEIKGRVASLLEVGTGFHPELSGRENVYLNGAILGMSRAEIKGKFDEIVAFAEIEKFLDTPVKRYSSGMYVRLAFAVAAHLEPEILIVDEVLAVGDAEFQKKCLGKMQDVAGHGRTVLFVSHQLASIHALCRTAILLKSGRVKDMGETATVLSTYMTPEHSGKSYRFPARVYNQIEPIECFMQNRDGSKTDAFRSSDPIQVCIRYRGSHPDPACRIGLRLSTADGLLIFTSSSDDANDGPKPLHGEHLLNCELPGGWLAPGRYLISCAADIPMREVLFDETHVLAFTINEIGAAGASIPDGRRGILRPALPWTNSPLSLEA
jgi:lipopolysaccharide transport system ATP-binding protein